MGSKPSPSETRIGAGLYRPEEHLLKTGLVFNGRLRRHLGNSIFSEMHHQLLPSLPFLSDIDRRSSVHAVASITTYLYGSRYHQSLVPPHGEKCSKQNCLARLPTTHRLHTAESLRSCAVIHTEGTAWMIVLPRIAQSRPYMYKLTNL